MESDHPSRQPEDDEREFVERAQRELPYGTAAFQVLIERHHAALFRRAFRILRVREDAEDVVQDVFLSVFRSLPRYRLERPFRHWLNTILVNACRLTLRRRFREYRRRIAYEAAGGPGMEPAEQKAEERVTVEGLLDTLTPSTRLAVVLRFLEGYEYPEIAEMLGKGESAVKMQVARALVKMKQCHFGPVRDASQALERTAGE